MKRWIRQLVNSPKSQPTRSQVAGKPPQLEQLEDRLTPVTINVQSIGAAGATPSPADNDFLRLSNAINTTAVAGDDIVLQGTFDFTEPNAFNSWALGSDGLPNTFDEFVVTIPANGTRNNLTITAAALGNATIVGPGELDGQAFEGAFGAYNDGLLQNLTISNLRFTGFENAISFLTGNVSDTQAAFNGLTITNNFISVPADSIGTDPDEQAIQNVGILLDSGINQTITNNVIELQGTGTSQAATGKFAASVGIQNENNNAVGSNVDGLNISGNTIRVIGAQNVADPEVVIGIWENSFSNNANITISGNNYTNQSPTNNPTTNLQRAFRVSSGSSATATVAYTGNSVQGANVGVQFRTANIGTAPVVFDGNTFLDNAVGISVEQPGTLVSFTNNSFQTTVPSAFGQWIGINAKNGGTVNVDGTTGANSFSNLLAGVNYSNSTSGSVLGNTYNNNVADVRVNGDAAANTFNFDGANTITFDGKTVTVDAAVSKIGLFGLDSPDTFTIAPSTTAIVSVDGGNPTTFPGDTLQYTNVGPTPTFFTNRIVTPGLMNINYVNIENLNAQPTLTVPGPQSAAFNTPLVFSMANGNLISVSAPNTTPVTVTLTATNGIITPGSGGAAPGMTVTLIGTPTDVNTQLAGLTYQPNTGFNGSDAITIMATQSGQTINGSIPITVAANIPPMINAIPDPAPILEDAGTQTVNLSGITDADPSMQTLTVTATSSTPGLLTNLTTTFNMAAGTGTVSYTPVANANGTTTITVSVSDGTTTTTRTFNVTVTPVNDAPSFTLQNTPITVQSDVGSQSVSIATNVSPGPANEAGQTVNFNLVSVSNPALFSVQPTIDANGTLTYTPAPFANGTTTITVNAMDNGGTANGGIDTSAPQTFNITITPQNMPPVAVNDTYSTQTNQPLTVAAANGLLANDTDADGPNPLQIVSPGTRALSNGNIQINADGSFTFTADAGFVGSNTFFYTVTDGVSQSTASATINVTAVPVVPPPPVPPVPPVPPTPPVVPIGQRVYSVSPDIGGGPIARVFDAAGNVINNISAFEAGFRGGIRTTTADFNGDGVADVVVGSGPGRLAQVIVFDGANGKALFQIQAFESTFTGGTFVATGDFNGDGIPDIVITPDVTGSSRTRIINGADGKTELANFFAIEDPGFRGGARAAVGDANGDGIPDLAVAAGKGGGPRVALFNGSQILNGNGNIPQKLVADFFLFEEQLRDGAYLALGDINGDGFADIIGGGGPQGGPRVFIVSGQEFTASGGANIRQLGNFFVGDPDTRGGVRVAAKQLTGDNKAELITGTGDQGPTIVTIYDGATIPPDGLPSSTLRQSEIFPGFSGGVFVG